MSPSIRNIGGLPELRCRSDARRSSMTSSSRSMARAGSSRSAPAHDTGAGAAGVGSAAGTARAMIARARQILAARDDDAVESREHRADDLVVDRLWRQQHGDAARAVDGLEVHLRQERGLHIPDAGLRLLEVGGQADERQSVGSHSARPPTAA